ncbi:reverse transcriptase [Gossypium australe]|uniref:Reverse transcriptase n=1 Tax=Gossypium australe TaxID=47621 RepID=A0A5B6VTZ1_9ROSI|nr:reverse transcriptase [Gossypium australe]
MAACTFPWENVSDPVTAEARARLQAITMVEEMDALTIVRKLNSAEEDRSSVSSLIQEIKGRKPIFRRLSFQYVPREANKVAHEMAKEGCYYEFP